MEVEVTELEERNNIQRGIKSKVIGFLGWFGEFKRKNAPYLFISPFYILFFIFGAFPLAFSAYLSVHNWVHISPASVPYIGLKNYIYLFTTDPFFLKSIKNTVILLFMGTFPQHLIALPLAFIINSGLVKLKNFFRATFFLPYITSTVIIAFVFSVIYGYRYGLLNFIIKTLSQHGFGGIFNFLHIIPTNWTQRAHTIQPAISFLLIWRWTGWNMILYLAGLQAIPKELYEAAKVDGANMRQVFFSITLPLLKPMILFAVTLSIIGGMQLFDEALVLTAGGSAQQLGGTMQKGLTTALYLYTTAFIWTKISVGCAMSWVLFAIIMIFSMLNFKLFRRGEM